MHQTNVDRIKNALNNVHEKKIHIINQSNDKEWKKKQTEIETNRKNKLDTLFSSINEMYICKKCNKNCRSFGTRLDDKVILKTGMCFDCLIDYETELRIDGKYQEYQLKKMQENAKSWLSEFKQQLDSYKKEYSEQLNSYVSDTGVVEKWEGGINPDDFNKLMDDSYEQIETIIFGEDNEEKNEKN